jgi:hypothetical protein
VNLNEATIEVYRDAHFAGYGSKTVLGAGDEVAPQRFPDQVQAAAPPYFSTWATVFVLGSTSSCWRSFRNSSTR